MTVNDRHGHLGCGRRPTVSREGYWLVSLVDQELRHRGNMAPTLVEHVVADAAAFLRKAPLQVRF